MKALDEGTDSMRKQIQQQRTRVEEAVADPAVIQHEKESIEKLKLGSNFTVTSLFHHVPNNPILSIKRMRVWPRGGMNFAWS